jgi:hypothetical protein
MQRQATVKKKDESTRKCRRTGEARTSLVKSAILRLKLCLRLVSVSCQSSRRSGSCVFNSIVKFLSEISSSRSSQVSAVTGRQRGEPWSCAARPQNMVEPVESSAQAHNRLALPDDSREYRQVRERCVRITLMMRCVRR